MPSTSITTAGSYYREPHRKDPWLTWTQTTGASITMSSFDDPWSTWNRSITGGPGDVWTLWNSDGSLTVTTSTAQLIHEQNQVWTSWARGPDIVVVRDYSARHAAEARRRGPQAGA